MKTKLILLTALLLSLSGCVTRKACNRKFPPVSSVVIKTDTLRERFDTVIYLPGSTLFLKDTIWCDSLRRIVFKPAKTSGKSSSLTVGIKNNILSAACYCEDSLFVLKGLRQYIATHIQETKTVVKNEQSPWHYRWQGALYATILLIVSYLGFLAFKRYAKGRIS